MSLVFYIQVALVLAWAQAPVDKNTEVPCYSKFTRTNTTQRYERSQKHQEILEGLQFPVPRVAGVLHAAKWPMSVLTDQ